MLCKVKALFRNRLHLLFILPLFIYLIVTCFFPLAEAFKLSFMRHIGNEDIFVGLRNYIKVVRSPYFLTILKNSFVFVFVTLALQNIVGMYFAVLLNQNIKFRSLFRMLTFLPWLFPSVVQATLWKALYLPVDGLINNFLRGVGLGGWARNWLGDPATALPAIIIVDVWQFFPFFTLMYLARMQNIPQDIKEAARVDGANDWQIFRHITFPLLRPVILSVSVLQTIWLFRFFDLIWIMTKGGPGRASEVLATAVYKTAFFRFQFGEAAALGTIMTIIMTVFVFLYFRLYRAE